MEPRTLDAGDVDQMWALDSDAFNLPDERRGSFVRHCQPERHIGIFDGDRLVAMTGAHAFGQWFGGRRVPMGGLSSVSVAPEWRGRGLARRTVEAVLQAMCDRGEVLSSLFPATTSLYRSLGWEVAGAFAWRRAVPAAFAGLPRPEGVRVRPARAEDAAAIEGCYALYARDVNGFIDRGASWWGALHEKWQSRRRFLAEGPDGSVDGYLVYHAIDGEYSALGGDFGIVVDELVANTRDAILALSRLLASWGTQVDQLLLRCAPDESLLMLLPEQRFEPLADVRWMTRVVDAPGAVAARGFPPGLVADISLALRDEVLPANDGSFRLRVREGAGTLERGGPGDVALDVGAFSALYTGWATPVTLARAGRLRGGAADARAALAVVFAGPTPWLLDDF